MKFTFKHLVSILSIVFIANFLQAQATEGYTWQNVHSVDFGKGANHFTIQAASYGSGGEVELRLDAADGPVIGRAYFHHTGITNLYPDSSVNFMDYECNLKQTVTGTHNVYMNFLDYSDPVLGGVLKVGAFTFNMVGNSFGTRDSLHVYPPVPGLDPSPYYEFQVQKVSKLNSGNLAEVTNWETPFAWFTWCPESKDPEDTGGHYTGYVGGWSHTYTNFELDKNTPVVVKITRKDYNSDGAPSGPISSASVRPEHRVDSWEIIDGELYVTLSNPALVGIDIDGQMDTRKAPRAKPTGWGDDSFPYKGRKNGAHTLSIFANPFIEDKPNPDDPGVLALKPGEEIPKNLHELDWDILYFEPGVHKASVDVNEDGELIERRWKPEDIIPLMSNRSYYIPGDAIVYGNFTDHFVADDSKNIRVFGHGTISGTKILFWRNWPEYPDNEYPNSQWHRSVLINGGENVTYEGVTGVDPSNHTFTLTSSINKEYPANHLKWIKVIAWRSNSDATAINGNIVMEDCFFRSQDDGHYIGGAHTMRRIVFWHDVNGQTFRGDFTTGRFSDKNASNIPKQILIEDIDVIYARGVFVISDNGFGIIGVKGGWNNKTLAGGVENTGQMVYFRNIRVSDPMPTRNLFSFDADGKNGDFAGIRFENIDYKGSQVFGWRNKLTGGPNAAIRNFVFDNVMIDGKKMDAEYVNDPEKFITNRTSDFTYRLTDTIASTGNTLTRTATNGTIKIEAGTSGEITLTADPLPGYKFVGWSGNLSGKNVNDTIIMDADKAITANFSLITYTLSTTGSNGSFTIDPALDKYLPGTVVTLKAVGNLGYGFDSWGGDLSGSVNPTTITMNGDKNVTATFTVIPTYRISTNATNGSILLNPAGGVYNQGTDVTVTAKAEFGYELSSWSGDLSGFENPTTLKMDSDKNIIANFKSIKGEILVFATNCGGPAYTSEENVPYQADNSYSGGGTFSNQNPITDTEDDLLYQSERNGNFSYNINLPNGEYDVILMFAEIFWGAPGQRVFDVSIEGTKVINQLDIFSKVGKNKPYEETHRVKLNDGVLNIAFATVVNNSKVSAIKVVVPGSRFDLLTSATNGSISLNPPGGNYDSTTVVALTANANSGYKFSGWSGDLTGTANPGSIIMDSKKVVAANFLPLSTFNVTTEATNGSIVLSPAGGSYTEGTRVTATATPNNGYEFSGWSGDLSGNVNPTSIEMSANKHLIATFVPIPNFTITAEATNGTISFTPQSVSYLKGTSVTVTATPDTGYVFAGWSGGLSGTNNPQTIVVDADKNIKATFNPLPKYTIKSQTANGSVSFNPPGGSYLGGTSVSLTATPDNGYEFVGWIGDISSTNNPLTVIVNANKNINAVFVKMTGIDELRSGVPNSFALEQNYPNPFSVKTTIPFQLSEPANVKISIFNSIGQEIVQLIDKQLPAGYHTIDWYAKDKEDSQVPVGIYLCRMLTGNQVAQTKKLIVTR